MTQQESAEDVVVGGNEPGAKSPFKQRYRKPHADEGPNLKEGDEPFCSSQMQGSTDLTLAGAEAEFSLPVTIRPRPEALRNRLVRTRMPGGVGRGS